ncbi:hypothetical protein INR49_005887 [Caranx melampygus]|nr:hypothetical protein INR49_005887 [Caranx melampygus]
MFPLSHRTNVKAAKLERQTRDTALNGPWFTATRLLTHQPLNKKKKHELRSTRSRCCTLAVRIDLYNGENKKRYKACSKYAN